MNDRLYKAAVIVMLVVTLGGIAYGLSIFPDEISIDLDSGVVIAALVAGAAIFLSYTGVMARWRQALLDRRSRAKALLQRLESLRNDPRLREGPGND